MAKLIGTDGAEVKNVKRSPKVKAVHPFGSTVLIEILNPDEVLNTSLFIGKETKVGSAPQAYVVELGPRLDPDVGLKPGDRVLVQGTFIPVENTGLNTERTWGILEVHNIKAILEEEPLG
jgi:hypothetical protein